MTVIQKLLRSIQGDETEEELRELSSLQIAAAFAITLLIVCAIVYFNSRGLLEIPDALR